MTTAQVNTTHPISNLLFQMPLLTQDRKSQIYRFALNQKYFIRKKKLGFILVAKKQSHSIAHWLFYHRVHRKSNSPRRSPILQRKDQIMNQETTRQNNQKAKRFFP